MNFGQTIRRCVALGVLHNLSGYGFPVSETQGLELSILLTSSPEQGGLPPERLVPRLQESRSARPCLGEAVSTGGDLLCGTLHPSPQQRLRYHTVALHVPQEAPGEALGEFPPCKREGAVAAKEEQWTQDADRGWTMSTGSCLCRVPGGGSPAHSPARLQLQKAGVAVRASLTGASRGMNGPSVGSAL